MMPGPEDEVIRRQRERARLMAMLLGAFVVLMFAITIAKMGQPVTALAQKNRTAASAMALFWRGDGRPRLRLGAALPLVLPGHRLRRHDRCAEEAPGAVAGQIGVRFDANIDPPCPGGSSRSRRRSGSIRASGRPSIYRRPT